MNKRPLRKEDSAAAGGYDPAFFDELARVEDRHFWFRARNRLIYEISKRISEGLKPGYLVLEVGCGTGNVLRFLRKACGDGTVVGMELRFEGLKHARKRSTALLVQGDVRRCPFGKPFEVVGMFDVLEHIEEDQQTLASLWELLAPGGRMLLTVPAHPSLWSYFDEASHHCRRYTAGELGRKLAAAGFEVEFQTQFMMCIFPMVWIFRKLSRFRTRAESRDAKKLADEEFRVVPVVNGILTALLSLEVRWVARGHSLPIGTSSVVIARKPK